MKQLSAKSFAASIEDIAAALRTKIELECEAFPADPEASKRRRGAVFDRVTGFEFFRKHYFPHYHEKPDSKLHKCLAAKLPEIAAAHGRKEVVVAPRGSAKSTICSLEFPIWSVLVGLKRFPILVSDASDQAELLLDAIKAEVEVNPRLRYDFPELAPGRVWRSDAITLHKSRLEALGSGKKVRGRRFGPHRPDMVVLDDIENDEQVRSPDQRDKMERWIDNAVLKSGKADGSMTVVFVGTILHFDAVLARKSRKPGWSVTRFDAILRWPDAMDAWEHFAELVANAQDDAFAAAAAFYAANQAHMDAGAEVVWPEMQSLLQLMTEWAEDRDAFMSERQNEPISRNTLFKDFQFWVQRLSDLVTFGAIDPSLGRKGQGRDPSAILVGGFNRATGVLDILEASIRRRLPDAIITDTIALQRIHNCQLWFVEAVQFQEFLRTEIMVKAAKAGVALPTVPVVPIADKELRIERLQPPIAAGLIRLHTTQIVLIDQLRQFPNAAHDDGPDCLEMLWTHTVQHAATALTTGLMMGASQATGGAMNGWRMR